jgi:S-DNA-T family DNA segregation ATPase FtsK/SpoIIIE
LFPLLIGVVGWYRFWCRRVDAVYTKLIGLALLFASATSFLKLALGPIRPGGGSIEPGGWIGDQLGGMLEASFSRTGSLIILLTSLLLSIVLTTQLSFGRMFAAIGRRVRTWEQAAGANMRERWENWRRDRKRREIALKQARRAAASEQVRSEQPTTRPAVPSSTSRASTESSAAVLDAAATDEPGETDPMDPDERTAPRVEPGIRLAPRAVPITVEPLARVAVHRRRGAFALPPLTVLDAPRTEQKIDERELMELARLLEEKCREFAVAGSVVQIHPGPVVTTFEFKPDAGVKYSKVTSLADDLSLALRAESVLIERLAGHATVGIQIPNHNREHIALRDLLESDSFVASESKLTLALGKTIHGELFVADLAAMPHLLIAGATGTGKSVALNAMLAGILSRATPDEVRLILIDPKRLELGTYEEIPHLLTPVVMDPKQASNALTWAVREMDERYKTLYAQGVRSIEQYNRNARYAAADPVLRKDPAAPKPLPYVLIVIDELADLMMVAGRDVEAAIARLAQKARAVGIHLLLATQRPSVDIITGLIKANLPARISFRVSSKVDSRTILDCNGAEQLLGRGDMLFLPPTSTRLIRLHGPYISAQESARLASFLRKQGRPVYDQTITSDETTQKAVAIEKDELYDEAVRLVVSTGRASISFLQRRLGIGFSRAAKLIDMMEAEGIVSPAVGGKPREVLVKSDYLEELDEPIE